MMWLTEIFRQIWVWWLVWRLVWSGSTVALCPWKHLTAAHTCLRCRCWRHLHVILTLPYWIHFHEDEAKYWYISIISRNRDGTDCWNALSILWLLMAWRHMEPTHQQTWYWRSYLGTFRFEHSNVKVNHGIHSSCMEWIHADRWSRNPKCLRYASL